MEIMWAIKSKNFGFYYGTFPYRHDAIAYHEKWTGHSWKYCRAKGDRAVKVELKEIAYPSKEREE